MSLQKRGNDLPRVVILVLTWNQKELTSKCLESILALNYPCERFHILVVDNASTDGTVASIQSSFPSVQIITNEDNLGYVGGNNIGLQYFLDHCQEEYVLILNNDVILEINSLRYLVTRAEQEPRVGILGPKVCHQEKPGVIQSAGGIIGQSGYLRQRGYNEADIDQFKLVEEVDAVIGCAMLVRREVVARVGLLDPRFYMYHEDTDWCLRARAEGFKVLFVPQAVVWHRDTLERSSEIPRITYYMNRNIHLLLSKQKGMLLARLAILIRNLVWLVNWSINPKWRDKRETRDALLKAIVDVARGKYGKQPYRYGL